MTALDNIATPRLTPTQRLHEVTMTALSRPHAEPESAVEISRNAKGDIQFSVTVRGADAIFCRDLAVRLVDELRTSYPHSSEVEAAAEAYRAEVRDLRAQRDALRGGDGGGTV